MIEILERISIIQGIKKEQMQTPVFNGFFINFTGIKEIRESTKVVGINPFRIFGSTKADIQ